MMVPSYDQVLGRGENVQVLHVSTWMKVTKKMLSEQKLVVD